MPLFPLRRRTSKRSTKSENDRREIRNEFWRSGLDSVDPTMTPSCTLQSLGSPSQPARSRPLKSDSKPAEASSAVTLASIAESQGRNEAAAKTATMRVACVPTRLANRTISPYLRCQGLGLAGGRQRLDEHVEIAIQDLGQLMDLEANAVVRDAHLRKVVRSNLL